MASCANLYGCQEDEYDRCSEINVGVLSYEWESIAELSSVNRELSIYWAKCPNVKKVYFFTQKKSSEEEKKEASNHGIDVLQLEQPPGLKRTQPLGISPRDFQIDVIVSQGVELGELARFIKLFLNCKWVHLVNNDAEELKMFKCDPKVMSDCDERHNAEVELCDGADIVVGVGPKVSEAFCSYLRYCSKDSSVIKLTPSIFDELMDVKQVSNDGNFFTILMFVIDGDCETKGLDTAAEVVKTLQNTRLLVVVKASEGTLVTVKGQLLEKFHVPKDRLRIRSPAEISHMDLKRLFYEGDIFLLPSKVEVFGVIALKALSAGLPVVVSKNSGFGQALSKVHFGSFFVIDPTEPDNWVRTVRKILVKDRPMRLQEAEELRRSFREKYSWTRQSKDILTKINLIHEGNTRKKKKT